MPEVFCAINVNFFYMHMPRRDCFVVLKYQLKNSLPVRRSLKQNWKNKQWPTQMQLSREASLQAFTAVSRNSSAEEGWTDTNA